MLRECCWFFAAPFNFIWKYIHYYIYDGEPNIILQPRRTGYKTIIIIIIPTVLTQPVISVGRCFHTLNWYIQGYFFPSKTIHSYFLGRFIISLFGRTKMFSNSLKYALLFIITTLGFCKIVWYIGTFKHNTFLGLINILNGYPHFKVHILQVD